MVSDCLAGCLLANKAMEASSINTEPQPHSCGEHKSSPILRPTADLTASSSNCRPHEAIGRANSQSPLCCVQAAKKEARLWGESSDDSTTALSANTPGRSQKGCLMGRISGMSPNWVDQAWLKDIVVRGNKTKQDVGLAWHGACGGHKGGKCQQRHPSDPQSSTTD